MNKDWFRINCKKHGEFICAFIKTLMVLCLLCLGYLYVLNGRYSHIGSFYYFDKWTQKIINAGK